MSELKIDLLLPAVSCYQILFHANNSKRNNAPKESSHQLLIPRGMV